MVLLFAPSGYSVVFTILYGFQGGKAYVRLIILNRQGILIISAGNTDNSCISGNDPATSDMWTCTTLTPSIGIEPIFSVLAIKTIHILPEYRNRTELALCYRNSKLQLSHQVYLLAFSTLNNCHWSHLPNDA